jgi:hypothetical protein
MRALWHRDYASTRAALAALGLDLEEIDLEKRP